MDIEKIREDFPVTREWAYFNTGYYGPLPRPVVQAMSDFLVECMCTGQGNWENLFDFEEKKERTRIKLANMLGASPDEIALTRSTTEGYNLALQNIDWKKGDEIIINSVEYPPNRYIYNLLVEKFGVQLVTVEADEEGIVNPADVEQAITEHTKLISMCHVAYHPGTILPAEEIGKIASENNILYALDGAQGPGYIPVNVKKLGCDFYAVAGHKALCGPVGTGCLYFKREHGEKMQPLIVGEPFLFGAEPTETISEEGRWLAPYKFEATSLNYLGFIGLGAAIDYMNRIGIENIRRRNMMLTSFAIDELTKIPNLKIVGTKDVNKRVGLLSIDLPGYPAVMLMPFAAIRKVIFRPVRGSISRISIHYFNTEEEILRIKFVIEQAVKLSKIRELL
ncbi:MAG: aminotransferase class V-fold PLP-dependent enzyme [Candidatus Jordarchaeaceae archaeon]